ncbi:septal ring lytic transglycosylase RlpA family protein [Allokutzneria oryzae]|uniref:Septal ring lytic transglycosylase RlpA family protein n=1 Tax=Allokutzneria oryzae TaxID=1378989 RepID=A0ABV5ZP86_9PSEU
MRTAALLTAVLMVFGLAAPASASEPPATTEPPAVTEPPVTGLPVTGPPVTEPKPEQCTATWYGKPGATTPVYTASGELLDPAAMTAAHATLPFDTQVKVTHRRTGLSVVVRINDRFAAQTDRCVNLTSGAFEKISPLSMGVAPVDVSVTVLP